MRAGFRLPWRTLYIVIGGVALVTVVEAWVTDPIVSKGDELSPDFDELPVFVWIGEVAKSRRPVASRIRLQPLDRCNMCEVNTFEIGSCAVRPEILFRVHNRKLRYSGANGTKPELR